MAAQMNNSKFGEVTFSFSSNQAERVPGGIILRGCTMHFQKRQHRHENPTKRKAQKKSVINLKEWRDRDWF